MERIKDLKHDQLIKLTEDDLQRFIDLEIAYAGIKMMNIVKPREITPVDIKPKHTFYKVNSSLYKSHAEAVQVASIPSYIEEYDYYGAG